MTLREVINNLDIKMLNKSNLDKEVKGCYIGDLLSNVMANAKKGQIWITIQGHQNIIAVSLLTDVSAVVVAENAEVDEKAIQRAEEKGVNLLRTELTAYEFAKRLTDMGV